MPSTATDRLNGLTTSTAVKSPVRVATTAAITLAGLQTIDGVTVVDRDRVLVKNQSDATANGIYSANTGTWSRTPDFDGSLDVVGGTWIKVNEGSVNADSYWEVVGDGQFLPDTDEIVFAPTSGNLTLQADLLSEVEEKGAAMVMTTARVPGSPGISLKTRSRYHYYVLDQIPEEEHAAIFAGTSTYDATADIQRVLDYMDEAAGHYGGTLIFPHGIVNISAQLTGQNWVAIEGQGCRSSYIHAMAGFTGASMIHFVNGSSGMFGCWIRDIFLDGKSHVDNCITSQALQDNSGLERCVLQGFNDTGLVMTDGVGGAAWMTVTNCEIFGNATSAQCGIRLEQISGVGAFRLNIRGCSITGASGNVMPIAVHAEYDSLDIQTLHVEWVGYAVKVEGVGKHTLDGVSGGPGVTTIFGIDSGFLGQVHARMLDPNTGTGYTVENQVTGENIATSEGVLLEYSYPRQEFEAYASTQKVDVTGNGTNYTVVFDTEVRDYSAMYNAATGVATFPKSGRYDIDVGLKATCGTGVTTIDIQLVVTGKTYHLFRGDSDAIRASDNTITLHWSKRVKVARSDTVRVNIVATGLGADSIDIEATDSIFAAAFAYT